MTELVFIPEWANILLTVLGCLGIGFQAVMTAQCFIRRVRALSLSRMLSEGALMLWLAVAVFCLTAERRWALEGTVIGTSFDVLRWIVCILAAVLIIATAVLSRRWQYCITIVPVLLTLPLVGGLPCCEWIFAGAVIAVAARAVVLTFILLHSEVTGINRMSVKHALDILPDGVLFARHDGSILLQNKAMMELTLALTGRIAADAGKLWSFVTGDTGTAAEKLLLDGDRFLFRTKQGRSWEFSWELIDINGRSITQIFAVDVTASDVLAQELERINAELAGSADRLQYILDNFYAIKTAQEAVAMKMRLHDRMGQQVSLISRAIADNTRASYADVVTLLRGLLGELSGESGGPAPLMFAEIEASFAFIGTAVVLSGELPEGEAGEVLLTVLREAATNAVRHAGARTVTARISETPDAVMMTVVNDGKPPEGAIAEGGGIGGMRKRLLRCGGRLDIETNPVFKLTVTLDKEKIL